MPLKAVENLAPGDTYLREDVRVTIVRREEDKNDQLGRPTIRYVARLSDGREGLVFFGYGARVHVLNTKKGMTMAKKKKRKAATGKKRCETILVSGKRCKCYCSGSGVYCAAHKGGKKKRKKKVAKKRAKKKVAKKKVAKKKVRKNFGLFSDAGENGYFPLPALPRGTI